MGLNFTGNKGVSGVTVSRSEKDAFETISVSGPFYDNQEKSVALRQAINLAVNGNAPSPIDFGMTSYYEVNDNILSLRFIDPENLKISETMITVVFKKDKTPDAGKIAVLMKSFVIPDNVKPKLDKASRPKAPTA